MAGWLAGRRNAVNFSKFSKFTIDQNNQLFASFNKGTALLHMYQCILSRYFRLKPIVRWFLKVPKIRKPQIFMAIPTIQ